MFMWMSSRGTQIVSQHCFRWWLGVNASPSHYLNQSCPRSIILCSFVYATQWVNTLRPRQNGALLQTTFSNAFSWKLNDRILIHISLILFLTHWGRVMHICVSELTIIGTDNGLSPGRRQAIIWNNAGLLLIEPLGTNFSEISIEIQTFSIKKMHLNMSSAKWRPFCLGLNVLMVHLTISHHWFQ